ncbi:hypothetical protein L916_21400 [Phytophthora nicotianae]|uniref:Uncharacterized protein n=1 Tax=Phytophthora nicotianae TaxID=4792 RepID=W2HS01_PHYNI|nr:hypothetical protein L916_21400 [Phytophthora nicotianae]
MDEKAAQMLKGKTVVEAEEALTKLTDDILPLLQNMDKTEINSQNALR